MSAPPFVLTIHKYLVCFVRIILNFVKGHGQSQPVIKDAILLESATSLAQKIRTKQLTSVKVLEAFIKRIEEINPLLNCVVENRFKGALQDAAAADELIASGTLTEDELATQKPFLGVPISTKDAIMVKDMLNTCGLESRRNIRIDYDSDAMGLMRKSGAIPFAITNVPECCMWWETNNTVYGRTKNPYDTNRIVGGSSGGEGCLLSAAGSPFGLGSDIGGSIRMPAYFNGIFGHKPSQYAVSNVGQFPEPIEELSSYLGIGPMCKYAVDLKPVLMVLAGEKAAQLRLDEPVDLAKVKFFYQENDGGGDLVTKVDSDIRDVLKKVVKHFKDEVKADVTKVQIEKFKFASTLWLAMMKFKGSPGVLSTVTNIKGFLNIGIELIKWLFGQSTHTLVAILSILTEQSGVQYGTPEYHNLEKQKKELIKQVEDMLGTNGVLIYPTHPTVAPYHGETIIRAMNFSYTSIINILGLPSTSIPLGLGREGVPLGLQVIAGVNQDRLCLAVATELEKAFGGWVSIRQSNI